MSWRLRLVTFLALFAISAMAAEPMMSLVVTKPDGMKAEVMFDSDKNSDRALVIRTTGVGGPGANLFLSVNGMGQPILTHVMSKGDCPTPASGGCEIVIGGKSLAYGRVIAALRHGKTLTIGVEVNNKIMMTGDVPLANFGASYDSK
jgi:hypothetical protein